MNGLILMGDVTSSRRFDGREVQALLRQGVAELNQSHSDLIVSPLTITLGDEFQSIITSVEGVCQLVFALQDWRLRDTIPFHLHYSIVLGEIETEINPDIAHGMLGAGLSQARQMLGRKDRSRPRYQIHLESYPAETRMLAHLFQVLEGLEDRWNRKDDALVLALLGEASDAELGARFDKDRSQIWKRRGTLLTDAYKSVRAVILDLARQVDAKEADHGVGGRAG